MYVYQRWGVLWRSENKLDGEREHIKFDAGSPLLFRTRTEAREYIRDHYGYIATRPDLRAEPHGWKMPLAVRVTVEMHYARPS